MQVMGMQGGKNPVGTPGVSQRYKAPQEISDPLAGGRRGQHQLNKAKSNDNFIGVPPDLTESSQKMPNDEQFDDEEDENDVQNNFLTQAELFRSYTD